ncbi:MAG: pyridoxal phosphate-dependent aminotransferase [Bacteroidales bacterium]|nr:pyridoxal phosphate-dependent aminotransferase [Bacteroidales bacterium]
MNGKYPVPEGSLISYFSNKVKQLGGINLAQGLPGFLPPAELMNTLAQTANRNDVHQYAPGIGNFLLIDHIVQQYKQQQVTKDEILITQGATEAITLVYIYLKQLLGNMVVLGFDPVYESYNNLPKIFGDRFISLHQRNNQIDLEELENVVKNEKVNLIFFNSPGNPLGRVFSEEDALRIVEIANKYSCFVIIDAVYREIYFSAAPHIPFNKENMLLFYVNSFSKLYSITGWRVGYLICNQQHMKKIRAIHDYTGLCVSNPIQTAIAEYISNHGFVNSYVSNIRKQIYQSFTYFSNILKNLGFELPPIEGGYFIWAKLPQQYTNGFDFATELYEKYKVAIIPGIHFSTNGNPFVRFNIAHPIEIVTSAAEKLYQFINENL